MAEPNYTNRETVPQQRSNGALIFIVGGLVVAVAFVVWLFASGSNWSSYTAPEATQPAGETNITIDNSAPAADPAAPAVETAPAADPAAPADGTEPADPAPAVPEPQD